MFQFNKIEYPECPECGTLINTFQPIPLAVITNVRCFHEMECPACHKTIYVQARLTLKLKAEKLRNSNHKP